MTRRAYFVMGPESSGTRITTRLLVAAGCWGDDGHPQRLDNFAFMRAPDLIVLRRSVPHATQWPPIAEIVGLMRAAKYEVYGIVTTRDMFCMVSSQVRVGHVPAPAHAWRNIRFAYKHIFKEIDEVGIWYVVSSYEALIQRPKEYSAWLGGVLGLPAPKGIEIRDGNAKYYGDN